MAGAALVVEALFGALHLIPTQRQVMVMQETIRWNYTSMLNVFFIVVSGLLFVRFLKTGGPAMLREMGGAAVDPMAESHSCCHEEPVAVAAAPSCCHEEPLAVAEVKQDCCHPKAEVVAEIKQDCCHVEPAPVAAAHDCCHDEPEPVAKHDCH
jgi:hypothetical protein